MNASMKRRPTRLEEAWSAVASKRAKDLVKEFEGEVGDGHEWNNTENIRNTRTALLGYIAELESHKKSK